MTTNNNDVVDCEPELPTERTGKRQEGVLQLVTLVDLFFLIKSAQDRPAYGFTSMGGGEEEGRREADDHNKKAVAEVSRVWQVTK